MEETEVKNCGENCSCKESSDTTCTGKCKCKEAISKLKSDLNDSNDKYVRLYAELDTFKRRVQKEKDELKDSIKINMLSSILEIDSDLSIAKKSIKNEEDLKGLDLIFNKLTSFLKSHGVEEIQTNTYDSDLHEVISIVPIGEKKIIDVISKGYTIGGKPFKYPKIVLGE
jgi:molecular chaperone GrpE